MSGTIRLIFHARLSTPIGQRFAAMAAAQDKENRLNQSSTVLLLWIGALAPPSAWVIHLSLIEMLVFMECAPALVYWLYGFTALALLVMGFSAYISVRMLRLARGQTDGASRAVMRTRFFGITGLLLSALFAFAVIAQAAPVAEHLVC